MYHLKNNPVKVEATKIQSTGDGNTDFMARAITTKISRGSFEAVKVVLEEAASGQAMTLEKGHDCIVHGGGGWPGLLDCWARFGA